MTVPLWGAVYDIGDVQPDDLVSLWGDGMLSELWEGRLVREAMTYPPHAFVANRIGQLLANYVGQQGLPYGVGQHMLFDLTQPGQPRTVLAPDVALVAAPQTLAPKSVPALAPDLAVEVLSPSQTMAQMRLKAQAYLGAGSQEVWIVDIDHLTLEVLTANTTNTYTNQQTILSPLVPGFTPTVRDLTP